ncbi:hypothetical protein [Nocardia sp. NPDC059239]|uniref:hypothetical protein n=1 Tax=unclassified Nocardia TaxID=2637762 RepID=UPI0036B35A67
MIEKTVSTIDEWLDYADYRFGPKADAIGQLAEQIRARFGANKHAAVTLYEARADPSGIELVIDCSGHEKSFLLADFEPSDYAEWLDEPRRWAEAERRRAAELKAAAEAAEARDQAQIDAITGALAAVEAEGYRNDRDWHDKLMDRLGVKH